VPPPVTPAPPVRVDLTIRDLAQLFGKQPSTVRAWVERGDFPGAYKLHGKEWRVPVSAVEAFQNGERRRTAKSESPLSAWRTVGRYLRGVSPQLRLPTTPRRVDVLADCGKIILYGRDRLKLTTQEVDYLFKKLRKTFELRDPLTRDWLATDSQARVHFLFNE